MPKRKVKRSLYYDEKDQRWVLILWDGTYAKHTRFDKTVRSEAQAKAAARKITNAALRAVPHLMSVG